MSFSVLSSRNNQDDAADSAEYSADTEGRKRASPTEKKSCCRHKLYVSHAERAFDRNCEQKHWEADAKQTDEARRNRYSGKNPYRSDATNENGEIQYIRNPLYADINSGNRYEYTYNGNY
jgi:hypothetical protein